MVTARKKSYLICIKYIHCTMDARGLNYFKRNPSLCILLLVTSTVHTVIFSQVCLIAECASAV